MLNRRLWIAVKSLALLITAGLVSGIVYEQIERGRDRSRVPQIGKSVDIGGRALNIFCSGTGEPPVIFESGGDGPGLEWESTQTEVAKFTQACGNFIRIGAVAHHIAETHGVVPAVLGGSEGGGKRSGVGVQIAENENPHCCPGIRKSN